MCSPSDHALQVSIPWYDPGSYCSVVGVAVGSVVSVLAEAVSKTGEGVRDWGVRVLCLEELSCGVTIGSGLLHLLDDLTSSLPSICELGS